MEAQNFKEFECKTQANNLMELKFIECFKRQVGKAAIMR